MELANYRFRGRRSDDKRWMYGDLYHAGDLVCICDWSVHPRTVENFAVDPTTGSIILVLQFLYFGGRLMILIFGYIICRSCILFMLLS